MLPLYDENPSARRPIATWLLILLNAAPFIWESAVTGSFSNTRAVYTIMVNFGATPEVIVEAIRSMNPIPLYTLFTSMFLHAGYFHIFGNMLYLFIFGDNVENMLGRVKFISAYLSFGLAGGFTHISMTFLNGGMDGGIPAVGASAAVSGVLGAYLVYFPRAKIVSIVFLWPFLRLIKIPAFFYLSFWFLLQFMYGVFQLGGSGGGVAYWAHIGGFLAGFIVAEVYKNAGRGRRPYGTTCRVI